MKKIQDMIDEVFELDLDPNEEFKKFASENELIDDTNEVLSNFYVFKRNSIIGIVSLIVLLVVSIGINVGTLISNNINIESSYYQLMSDSIECFNEYITNNDSSIRFIPNLSRFTIRDSVLNIYQYDKNYYIQYYIESDYDKCIFDYSIDGEVISNIIENENNIYKLGDINNKEISINIAINDIITDSFSFKIQ